MSIRSGASRRTMRKAGSTSTPALGRLRRAGLRHSPGLFMEEESLWRREALERLARRVVPNVARGMLEEHQIGCLERRGPGRHRLHRARCTPDRPDSCRLLRVRRWPDRRPAHPCRVAAALLRAVSPCASRVLTGVGTGPAIAEPPRLLKGSPCAGEPFCGIAPRCHSASCEWSRLPVLDILPSPMNVLTRRVCSH